MKEIKDKENVTVATSQNPTMDLTMSRDILEKEMHSAKVFDETEKLSRTELVNVMLSAKESVMTVKFHTKVDEKYVKEILEGAKKDQFTNPQHRKELAKELVAGKEVEMTCFLLRKEGQLGRSSVIDLNHPVGFNFRQVDHRTVESVVLKNKLYVVKK